MQQKIRIAIQKALAKSEFDIEIVPRTRGKEKVAKAGYVKKTRRDDEGNPLDKDGNLILTRLRVDKTMSPREQYLMSSRNPRRN